MLKISFLLTHKLSSFINDQYDIKFVFVIVIIFKIIIIIFFVQIQLTWPVDSRIRAQEIPNMVFL